MKNSCIYCGTKYPIYSSMLKDAPDLEGFKICSYCDQPTPKLERMNIKEKVEFFKGVKQK